VSRLFLSQFECTILSIMIFAEQNQYENKFKSAKRTCLCPWCCPRSDSDCLLVRAGIRPYKDIKNCQWLKFICSKPHAPSLTHTSIFIKWLQFFPVPTCSPPLPPSHTPVSPHCISTVTLFGIDSVSFPLFLSRLPGVRLYLSFSTSLICMSDPNNVFTLEWQSKH
jgi:hypothetical protein